MKEQHHFFLGVTLQRQGKEALPFGGSGPAMQQQNETA